MFDRKSLGRLVWLAVKLSGTCVLLLLFITGRYVWWYHLSVAVVIMVAVGLTLAVLGAGERSRFVQGFVQGFAKEAAGGRTGLLRGLDVKLDGLVGLAYLPALAGTVVLTWFDAGVHARVGFVLGALFAGLAVGQAMWEFIERNGEVVARWREPEPVAEG